MESETDFGKIATELADALVGLAASIRFSNKDDDTCVSCDYHQFTQASAKIAQTATWAKGLDKSQREYNSQYHMQSNNNLDQLRDLEDRTAKLMDYIISSSASTHLCEEATSLLQEIHLAKANRGEFQSE